MVDKEETKFKDHKSFMPTDNITSTNFMSSLKVAELFGHGERWINPDQGKKKDKLKMGIVPRHNHTGALLWFTRSFPLLYPHSNLKSPYALISIRKNGYQRVSHAEYDLVLMYYVMQFVKEKGFDGVKQVTTGYVSNNGKNIDAQFFFSNHIKLY